MKNKQCCNKELVAEFDDKDSQSPVKDTAFLCSSFLPQADRPLKTPLYALHGIVHTDSWYHQGWSWLSEQDEHMRISDKQSKVICYGGPNHVQQSTLKNVLAMWNYFYSLRTPELFQDYDRSITTFILIKIVITM